MEKDIYSQVCLTYFLACLCKHGTCDSGLNGTGHCKPGTCVLGFAGSNCDNSK